MAKVHAMRWSCPYYNDDCMDPDEIYENICPHFDPMVCVCELNESWFDCDDYQAHYGCDDFEEE